MPDSYDWKLTTASRLTTGVTTTTTTTQRNCALSAVMELEERGDRHKFAASAAQSLESQSARQTDSQAVIAWGGQT